MLLLIIATFLRCFVISFFLLSDLNFVVLHKFMSTATATTLKAFDHCIATHSFAFVCNFQVHVYSHTIVLCSQTAIFSFILGLSQYKRKIAVWLCETIIIIIIIIVGPH